MQHTSRINAERRTAPRGLTLIECTISIALVALVVVTALEVSGTCVRLRAISRSEPHGRHLALELLTEILECAFEEPDDFVLFGTEAGEIPGNRSTYDDVDDYSEWSSSPPKSREGAEKTEYAGWGRSVGVTWVDNPDLDTPVGGDTGLKRIVVTVTSPTGRSATVTGLRTRMGGIDYGRDHDRTYPARFVADLQIGAESSARLRSGAMLVNEPSGGTNRLANAGFELGVGQWSSLGGTLVESADPHSGAKCALLKNRSNKDAEIRQNVAPFVQNGQGYVVAAWVKTASDTEMVSIAIHVQTAADGELVYWTVPIEVGTTWKRISSVLTPAWTGELQSARWRLSTVPDGGSGDLFVDDTIMMETP